MKKAVKIMGVVLCFMFVIVISQCDTGVKFRGVYSADDNTNDSVEFMSGSRNTFDLDGEKNEGTYKIYEKTLTIAVKGSPRYIMFIIVDENTILRQFSKRVNGNQIFTKEGA